MYKNTVTNIIGLDRLLSKYRLCSYRFMIKKKTSSVHESRPHARAAELQQVYIQEFIGSPETLSTKTPTGLEGHSRTAGPDRETDVLMVLEQSLFHVQDAATQ
ncbi:hypothetical protein FQA47_001877 [Oryzias melastigma]|uniref:Uncharacterized protein n=1 Tax=Oryzias melastigma TaxID=30732 RepID=A0A834KW72_ORYME|nr:hypothetical protein FQA47_001877 [Oryzias melastigma]